jgi:hypothetical protein
MSLFVLELLWLLRVPAGADYATDLLPPFLLAGIAIGLSAPSVQIGELSGVSGRSADLASGLVEMREIGERWRSQSEDADLAGPVRDREGF